MNESRITYLRRVLPDLKLIEGDIVSAAQIDPVDARFSLDSAIARVRRLLEDLERARSAGA